MSSSSQVALLLVDDTPANLIALEAIFADSGYRLVTAASGAEGLQRLAEEEFAVILSDILMPEMDGFQFAKRVRASSARDTPIIFLTAAANADVLATRAYLSGAIEFLVKPLNPDVVRRRVADLVATHHLRSKAPATPPPTSKRPTPESSPR
jgi:CheY-like chemotaxis protein